MRRCVLLLSVCAEMRVLCGAQTFGAALYCTNKKRGRNVAGLYFVVRVSFRGSRKSRTLSLLCPTRTG